MVVGSRLIARSKTWVKDLDGESSIFNGLSKITLEPENDGNHGADSGHVRVFKCGDDGTGEWKQSGDDVDGEAAGDFAACQCHSMRIGGVLPSEHPRTMGLTLTAHSLDSSESANGTIQIFSGIN